MYLFEIQNIYKDNFNVINSDEIGLSRSRNLAIKTATSDLCLFSDDDIIYEPNFDSIVIKAFDLLPDADIITFQMNDFEGNLFRKYPKISLHNKCSLLTLFNDMSESDLLKIRIRSKELKNIVVLS